MYASGDVFGSRYYPTNREIIGATLLQVLHCPPVSPAHSPLNNFKSNTTVIRTFSLPDCTVLYLNTGSGLTPPWPLGRDKMRLMQPSLRIPAFPCSVSKSSQPIVFMGQFQGRIGQRIVRDHVTVLRNSALSNPSYSGLCTHGVRFAEVSVQL